MSKNKTQPTDESVMQFIQAVDHETRREDALTLLEMMTEVTGEEAQMWGTSIVGFGSYHYTYDSGREGDMCIVGFSPRKQRMSVYIMDGFDKYDELLGQLGKHKTGKACLYINKLADVDMDVLKQLVASSVEHMRATNSPTDDA